MKHLLAAVPLLFLALAGCASSETSRVLFLPQDQDAFDGLQRAGTVEHRDGGGLRVLEVPGAGLYHVIDRTTAIEREISTALADVHAAGSDISIAVTFLRTAYLHLDVDDSGLTGARYYAFDGWLRAQIAEQLATPGQTDGTVEYKEYRIEAEQCPELAAAVANVTKNLIDAVAAIGRPDEAVDEIVIDGRHYELSARTDFTVLQLGIGENQRSLFEPVDTAFAAAGACSTRLVPEPRRYDFGLR